MESVDDQLNQSIDEMHARIARFDAMIERAKRLPPPPSSRLPI